MTTYPKLKLALAPLLLLGLLTACGKPVEEPDHTKVTNQVQVGEDESSSIKEVSLELKNGNRVTCLVYEGYKRGGLWCEDNGPR